MAAVQRSVLVEFSASEMYRLVDDIESYPAFLPWCNRTEIVSRTAEHVVATIHIDFRGLRQKFTTENSGNPGELIRIALVAGPFRRLEGAWRFQALAERACKVSLVLDYEFSGGLLDRVLGPVFHQIADSLVDAFVTRAQSVYGQP
jgi:ribosome-associated toxin RatA of RatAB toxin-antitoxin module